VHVERRNDLFHRNRRIAATPGQSPTSGTHSTGSIELFQFHHDMDKDRAQRKHQNGQLSASGGRMELAITCQRTARTHKTPCVQGKLSVVDPRRKRRGGRLAVRFQFGKMEWIMVIHPNTSPVKVCSPHE